MTAAMHLQPAAGRHHTLAADRFTVKLTGSEEFAPYSLFEYTAAPGMPGPPLHIHQTFEEAWFILEGEVAFTLGDGVEIGRAGSFLWVPRGAMHTFAVHGDAPARWVGIISPGRHVSMLDDLGALLERTPMPAASDMMELFARHESAVVPPPAQSS